MASLAVLRDDCASVMGGSEVLIFFGEGILVTDSFGATMIAVGAAFGDGDCLYCWATLLLARLCLESDSSRPPARTCSAASRVSSPPEIHQWGLSNDLLGLPRLSASDNSGDFPCELS